MDTPARTGDRSPWVDPPLRPSGPAPSVRARVLYGFHELVTREGADSEQLLRDCGIDPSRLTDPGCPVSGVAVAQLLETASRTLRTPDFGLQLSSFHDASIIGTVALIVVNSDTVGAALDAIAGNIKFHNPGASVSVTTDSASGIARYEHDPGLGDGVPRRQSIEMVYAIAFRLLCTLTGDDGSDWRVRFRHGRGATLRKYRQHFSCSIEFERDRDCIEFPSHLLQREVDHADPNLRALASRCLRRLQRRYPSNLRRQVLELVRRQIPNGGGGIARISAILGLHPKTLQRRLREENTTFEEIADDVRRALAEEYLVFSFMSFKEVAALAGYSGQTTFIVACRRWFGTTPKQYRARFLRGAATAVILSESLNLGATVPGRAQ